MNKPYTLYEESPVFLKPGENFTIETPKGGTILISLPDKSLKIPSDHYHYFDLVSVTMEGLFEDLIPGSELMEQLLQEWELFQECQNEITGYGTLVWYPAPKHLVRFAPRFWHRLALLVRNKTLYQDPEMKLSWQEVRERFEKAVIAIAGCSLGNNAAHAIAWDFRPLHLKVADFKDFHMANGNRVRLTYEDFGRNKALVTAKQLHGLDPFMKVSVYAEGIHEEILHDFVAGDLEREEPPATVIVEEIDDIKAKFRIRQLARQHRISVVMASDIGSAMQLDTRRFDINPTLPLFGCGVSDEESLGALKRFLDTKKEEDFMNLFLAIVGTSCLGIPEFKQLMLNGLSEQLKQTPPTVTPTPPLFKGLPQLGSTAIMSAAFVTDAVARILLGYRTPERMLVDKRDGTSVVQGEWL